MTWDYYDIKKKNNDVYDRYRPIDATSMHDPMYIEVKVKALYDLLLNHYSMPDLEQALIERMETILN